MKPELVVMLTHKDMTVKNAHDLFELSKELPISYWGFKDIGLPPDEMATLVKAMKDAGKTTCLEVVSLAEPEGLRGAELAVDMGFDILMGTVYFDSIMAYLQDKPIKYYPFPGHVHSHPSILDGTIEEIVANARSLEAKGVHGLDLLTYRYTGDAYKLLQEVVKGVDIPVCSAGSIADFDRICEVWSTGAWGFTIGSAFFDQKFFEDGTFTDNAAVVCEWLNQATEENLKKYLT